MPKYKFQLACTKCGRSASKEYNETEQRIDEIFRIAQRALMLPQYLLCPQCLGIRTINPNIEEIKGDK